MTTEREDLQVGQKVHYRPDHYEPSDGENGIVKEIRAGIDDAVWVVYHCGNNWDEYQKYTGAKTLLGDLRLGWQ